MFRWLTAGESHGRALVAICDGVPAGVRVTRLRVDERGEFADPWPRGFFDERFAEVYGP